MKGKRQEKILEIIKEKVILTQDDLQNELNAQGFNVTQSTVSRDIKELKLIKGHDAEGKYRYVVHSVRGGNHSASHYRDTISHSLTGVDYAMNNIVLKCFPGMASSVCVAVDVLFSEQMLGTVAGDDTILIITRSVEDSAALSEEIKKLM